MNGPVGPVPPSTRAFIEASFAAATVFEVTASYAGDENHLASDSLVKTVTVTLAPPPFEPLKPQTISFTAPQTSLGIGLKLGLTGTASSALPVTYTTTTPTICSISGSVVTAKAKGTCSITALQAGNTVYASAVPVTVKIAVRLAVYLTASVSVGGKTMTANPLTVKKYTKVTLKVSTKPVLKTKYVELWYRIGTGTWMKLTTRKTDLYGRASYTITATRAARRRSFCTPATRSRARRRPCSPEARRSSTC